MKQIVFRYHSRQLTAQDVDFIRTTISEHSPRDAVTYPGFCVVNGDGCNQMATSKNMQHVIYIAIGGEGFYQVATSVQTEE